MSSRLEEMVKLVTADSEESVDDVLALLSPEKHDKEEMQQTFEEVIGYDPINYYDKEGIKLAVDEASERVELSEEVRLQIAKDKEQLADAAFESFDSAKPSAYRHHVDRILEEEGLLESDSEEEEDD